MAKLKRSLRSPASERGKSTEYDAFLSYAHHDRQVTTAIQKGLHQIGRRVGQLRALRVFRDDTNLTASPDLWGKITEALDRCGYMIVVLSPQSAASHWVNEEIRYRHRRGHQPGWTSGRIDNPGRQHAALTGRRRSQPAVRQTVREHESPTLARLGFSGNRLHQSVPGTSGARLIRPS
jgi:TIR domain